MKLITKITLILLLTFSYSCAKKEKDKPTLSSNYQKAFEKVEDRDYLSAAEDFKQISDEYPLSKWGAKAKTMAAYSYYQEGELDEVITTVEDFLLNNPADSGAPYMHYLKSTAYYNQLNEIDRSQDHAKSASFAFRELIARFPSSKYVDDSRKKLVLVDEHIAGAKMSVGRFQIKSRNYIGAIKNFQNVTYNYSKTKQAEEAYFRLFEIHRKLGLEREAISYLRQLKENYPKSIWI